MKQQKRSQIKYLQLLKAHVSEVAKEKGLGEELRNYFLVLANKYTKQIQLLKK